MIDYYTGQVPLVPVRLRRIYVLSRNLRAGSLLIGFGVLVNPDNSIQATVALLIQMLPGVLKKPLLKSRTFTNHLSCYCMIQNGRLRKKSWNRSWVNGMCKFSISPCRIQMSNAQERISTALITSEERNRRYH
jgi:hypothetical protein